MGRRVPKCPTEASELGIFTEGVMGWVCQDPGPPVSSGNPLSGFPKPESPVQISAPGVCDHQLLSGEQSV